MKANDHIITCWLVPLMLLSTITSFSQDLEFTAMKFNLTDSVLSIRLNQALHPDTIELQQYRWNRWMGADIVEIEDPNEALYRIKVNPGFGEAKFRVIIGPDTSSAVRARYGCYKDVDFWPKRVNRYLHFSQVTDYEIFDANGDMLKSGTDSIADLRYFKTGVYYVNYCNASGKFLKR